MQWTQSPRERMRDEDSVGEHYCCWRELLINKTGEGKSEQNYLRSEDDLEAGMKVKVEDEPDSILSDSCLTN